MSVVAEPDCGVFTQRSTTESAVLAPSTRISSASNCSLDVAVKILLIESRIESRVERMRTVPRQIWVATHIDVCIA